MGNEQVRDPEHLEEKDDIVSIEPSFFRTLVSSHPPHQIPLYPIFKDNIISDSDSVYPHLGMKLDESEPDNRIFHIKSLQQVKKSDNCGYHSLYSGEVIYRMINSTDEVELESLKKTFYSFSTFREFSFRIGKILLDKCKRKGNRFPWESENVRSGIIERGYMNYLLKDKPDDDVFFNLPDVSPMILSEGPGFLSPDTSRKISERIKKFTKCSMCCVIFVTSTLQHWFDIIWNKYEEGKSEFIIICSNNRRYFKHDKDDESSEESEGEESDDYSAKRKQKSIDQTSKIIKMIIRCCMGRLTFHQYVVDRALKGQLNEYYRHEVGKRVWGFLDEFPCKQMEDGILKVFDAFPGSIKTSRYFERWSKQFIVDCKSEMEILMSEKELEQRKKDRITRFKGIVEKMESYSLHDD